MLFKHLKGEDGAVTVCPAVRPKGEAGPTAATATDDQEAAAPLLHGEEKKLEETMVWALRNRGLRLRRRKKERASAAVAKVPPRGHPYYHIWTYNPRFYSPQVPPRGSPPRLEGSILFASLADDDDQRDASPTPDFHDIRADRQSILGNPFRLGSSGEEEDCRESACDAHAAYLDALMAEEEVDVEAIAAQHGGLQVDHRPN